MIQYVELRLYDALTGDDFVILSDFKNLSFDKRRNDIGVINFDYPLDDAQALGVDAPSARVGVVLGFSDGSSVEVEQYLLEVMGDEKVTDSVRMLSVSGECTLSVLKDAVVYPENGAGTAPSGHEFVDNNIGTIMRTLMLHAHLRGTITQVDETSFSGTLDSAGHPWDNIFSVVYSTGVNYWQTITDRTSIGLADVKMDGWDLKIYNGGALGNHVSIDTLEVRPALNVTDLITNTDRTDAFSTVLIEGDEGTSVERHSSPAVANIGRRRETYLGQSGIKADGVLTIIGDAYLSQVSTIPVEETVGITSQTTADAFKDFDVNDWVWVRFEGSETAVERRIYQIAVAIDDDGTISVGLTLNSIIAENMIRLQRQIDAYASGGIAGSVPSPDPGDDLIKPNPATSIVLNSAAYEAQGATQAAVSVTWTDPTLNEDGTAFTDFDHYELQWRYSTDPAFSGNGTNTYTSYSKPWGYNPLVPGNTMYVRVRVVDQAGNKSNWLTSGAHTISNDTIAPSQPSQPTTGARGGVVYVQWDGLTNGGGAMPSDFRDLQVHRSTTSGFTPTWDDAATLCGTLTGPDIKVFTDLALSTTWYFKFLARDRAGNISTASPQSSAQNVTPIVDTDLVGRVIAGANIKLNTMTASDNIIGNTITGGLIQALAISAGHINVNSINAGMIQTGALSAFLVNGNLIIASSTGSDTGTRVRMSSLGLSAWSGTSTKTFDLDAATGNVSIYGATIKTVNTSTGARAEMTSSGFAAYNSGGTALFSATTTAVTVNGILRTDVPGNPRLALSSTSGSGTGVMSFFYTGSESAGQAAFIDSRLDPTGNPAVMIQGGASVSGYTNSSATWIKVGGWGPSGQGDITLSASASFINLNAANVLMPNGFTAGTSAFSGPVDMTNHQINNVSTITATVGAITTLSGGPTINGTVTFGSLAGTGSRTVVAGAGGVVSAPTSSRRYKENFLDITLEQAKNLYRITPIAWQYKDREMHGHRFYGGFGAEDLEEVGLGLYLDYDKYGRPDNVRAESLTAPLLVLIQDLNERLSILESKASA